MHLVGLYILKLALYDEIPEQKKFASRWISGLDFFKSLSKAPVFFNTGRDNTDDPTTVQTSP